MSSSETKDLEANAILAEKVWRLKRSHWSNVDIAAELRIEPAKVREIIDARNAARQSAYRDGWTAAPGDRCPFPYGELGLRCAWLGGHYDRHGTRAWELARS